MWNQVVRGASCALLLACGSSSGAGVTRGEDAGVAKVVEDPDATEFTTDAAVVDAGADVAVVVKDASVDAAPPPVNVFTGAPAYVQGTANGNTYTIGAHNQGEVGKPCLKCHVAGLSYMFAGSIGGDISNSIPGCEVRVTDVGLNKTFSVYTDGIGNFWRWPEVNAPAVGPFRVGIRNAKAVKVPTGMACGVDCNACHNNAERTRLWLPQ